MPISRNITQLIISPTSDYLAILTSHTIHVAILPDSSHLSSADNSPIRLKTYHVGPTAHVLERSPIASVLWHPHGVNGSCLITITVDAVVRLWELERDNKWSFDSPALAIDLKKLANATSAGEDVSPSKYGTHKGFSPDSFEMEVASACFGTSNQDCVGTWATMTLWVAMREGDIYALCPLLPSKWATSPSHSQSLGTSIACQSSSANDIDEDSKDDRRVTHNQTTWIADILEQHSAIDTTPQDPNKLRGILRRPVRPGSVPMLQGPFHITPDTDEIFDIADICTLVAHDNETVDSEDDFDEDFPEDGASIQILCIAASDGKVHLCVDVGGVEGRWLPPKSVSLE